jgi:hypothetical protein
LGSHLGSNVLLFTRPAEVADAAPFAAAMRAQDRAEFEALGDPVELLAGGIRNSVWSYVAEDAGGYAAMWGFSKATLLGGHGHAWCATTERVLLHKRQFLQGSRAWALAMRAECDLLSGWCLASYDVSIRWLRWLEFEIGPAMPLGLGGAMFRPFWWRAGDGR